MRQWKLALSLAIVGALASPFVSRTYRAHPTSETWVPLTATEKANIVEDLERTQNCQTPDSRRNVLYPSPGWLCKMEQNELADGGKYLSFPSVSKYVALNTASAAGGFILVFGLAFFLPRLGRHYWRWLNS